MKTHKDLEVWKRSIEFVSTIYKDLDDFPKSEMYGIISQLKRSAVSVPSNIAEGAARPGNKEFIRFLYVALSSAAEVDTQLLISKNLGFLSTEKYDSLSTEIEEICKMLQGLIRYRKKQKT